MPTSSELFERAKKVIPGGVNSPVRAFLSVHGTPRFIKGGQGSHIFDVEGREYIDYVGSWGPLILGHAHPAVTEAVQKAVTQGLSFGAATAGEVEIAELICQMVPSVEMVRMVNSGTEAVMSALRLARGYTGRSKIIKFTGCYHGHSDAMLVKAGSGLMTGGVADSAGVPPSVAADTLLAEYNNLNSVEELFNAYPSAIAAVIVEPVAANMGVVLPEEGFLPGLRRLCDKYQSLLIFDEVITGFRLAPGGAQEFYGILPDLTTLGKIIGGGMPVGAYGGRREIMQQVAPLGPVYQAGTLSGNPVAMAAGLATLRILSDNREIYQTLDELSQIWARGVRRLIKNYQMPVTFNAVGSISSLFFTPQPVKSYHDAKGCDTALYELYFNHMLACGIYLAPSQFEASFVSAAHSRHDVVCALEAFTDFVGIMDWSGQ